MKKLMNDPKQLLDHNKWLENLEKIRCEVNKTLSN